MVSLQSDTETPSRAMEVSVKPMPRKRVGK